MKIRKLLVVIISAMVILGLIPTLMFVFSEKAEDQSREVTPDNTPEPVMMAKNIDSESDPSESVFDVDKALKSLRKYAASDPLPDYFIDEYQYVREHTVSFEEYGEYVVGQDENGTVSAYSMKDNSLIEDFDPYAVDVFTKARLQFLLCPDTMMITEEEVESNEKTGLPEFTYPFVIKESIEDLPVDPLRSYTRYAITDSTVNPYYAICYIAVSFPTGGSGYATGFLINNNTVVTAGHALYQPSLGEWASSVTVYPGKNGSLTPYGSVNKSSMWVGGSWYTNADPTGDFGVIRLSSNAGVPAHFWMAERSDTQLSNLSVKMTGYPSDKSGNTYTMWESTGNVYGTTTYLFYCDAYGTYGISGSPVCDTSGWVVGIATGNAPGSPATGGSTRAVRITNGFITWVNGL